MIHWLKTLTGCLCILTIFVHLVPGGTFTRYVRFYGTLLFLLAAAGPLLRLLAGEGELEKLLQLEFLREDHYNLETSISGMAELKNEQIRLAYRREMTRQVSEIAAAYGVTAENIRLSFDEEEEYRLMGVGFEAHTDDGIGENADLNGLRRELSGVFALDAADIRIGGQ